MQLLACASYFPALAITLTVVPGEGTVPIALVALVVAAFGIGTTEFVTTGLVPQLSAEFDASIPAVGLLISGYAFGVAVGAPILTALGARVPHKQMLMLLMVFYIVGNVICALAPSYGVMMTGRVVSSFTHGAFFGIGAVVAADLVPPQRRAQAIALMFTGVTLANVLGAPGGTFIGQAYGWRAAFWVIVAIGVVALLGLALLVPASPRAENAGITAELAAFARPQVWLVLAITVIGYSPVFAVYAYIEPLLTQVAGFSDGAVPVVQVVFGVGLVAGNLVGGRLADRHLMPTLYAALGGIAVVSLSFWFTAHSPVAVVVSTFAFGFIGFASVPPLQTLILSKATGAPALASAANIGAFNLGNGIGPMLGGWAIASGLGFTAPAWIGALLGALGLGLALFTGRLDRRSAAVHATARVGRPGA
jgi:MFS transporter, DHA1 family, inner membrane transport protein